MNRSSSKYVPLFLSSHFILISFLILPNTFCHAQLVPEWLVTGNSHFTGMETATGIAACEGGFYLTGGRIQNDFVLQVSDDRGLNWQTVHDSLQDPPFGLTAISCANERHVIAVGRIGKLLHSNDGGLLFVLFECQGVQRMVPVRVVN